MTKDQFLARCALIYDTGHARPEVLRVVERACDAIMRYTHYAAIKHLLEAQQLGDTPIDAHWRWQAARQQKDIFDKIIEQEVLRVTKDVSPEAGYTRTLANDPEGYKAVEVGAILTHHCQLCATDPRAWWTRSGLCTHRDWSKP